MMEAPTEIAEVDFRFAGPDDAAEIVTLVSEKLTSKMDEKPPKRTFFSCREDAWIAILHRTHGQGGNTHIVAEGRKHYCPD